MGLKELKLKTDNYGQPKVVNVSVYLCFGGGVGGPYGLPQLCDMSKNGQLPPETLCNFGAGDWLKLYEIPLINIIRENCAPQPGQPESQPTVSK